VRILRSQIDSCIGLGHEGSRELERGTDQAVFFPGIQGARHRSIWFRRESDLFMSNQNSITALSLFWSSNVISVLRSYNLHCCPTTTGI
jgi:hypothetical protein